MSQNNNSNTTWVRWYQENIRSLTLYLCKYHTGGVGDFKWHYNGLLSDATVVTKQWSSCYFRVVNSMAALCRRLAVYSGSFRWQMTVVEIIIADLHCLSSGGRRVGLCLCVFVNAVCAGEQCTCETCICARYRTTDSLGPSALLSSYVISSANAVLQHLTHVTKN